jgi:hypothetical protein
VSKSVRDGAIGDYRSDPVTILYKDHSSVRFQINQKWVDGDLGWVSVGYNPIDSTSKYVCNTVEGVNAASSTPGYTAKCLNGFATVDVVVSDCSFTNVSNVVVPGGCSPVHDYSSGSKVAFKFLVSCDPEPEICVRPLCVPEAKLLHKSVPSGVYGNVLRNPVNILHYGGDSVQFRVEQTWKDDDIGWISVGFDPVKGASDRVCLTTDGMNYVSSTPDYVAKCVDGVAKIDIYAYDCSFSNVTNIDSSIPASCLPWNSDSVGNKVFFQYAVPCRASDTSFCSSASECKPVVKYGDSSVSAASRGDYSSPPVSIVRAGGSKVDFRLNQVIKQGDLGWIAVNYPTGDSTSGSNLGSVCRYSEALSAGDSTDIYTAQCTNGVAEIEIYAYDCTFVDVPIIDNLVPASCQPWIEVGKKVRYQFTLPCLCDSSSLPVQKTMTGPHQVSAPIIVPVNVPVDAPSRNNRRELDVDNSVVVGTTTATDMPLTYYCLAKEFPCQGGNDMVHICHYTARKGYETFCIPEADSEVLRFYSHDYCGPCRGGFGGVNMI